MFSISANIYTDDNRRTKYLQKKPGSPICQPGFIIHAAVVFFFWLLIRLRNPNINYFIFLYIYILLFYWMKIKRLYLQHYTYGILNNKEICMSQLRVGISIGRICSFKCRKIFCSDLKAANFEFCSSTHTLHVFVFLCVYPWIPIVMFFNVWNLLIFITLDSPLCWSVYGWRGGFSQAVQLHLQTLFMKGHWRVGKGWVGEERSRWALSPTSFFPLSLLRAKTPQLVKVQIISAGGGPTFFWTGATTLTGPI